MVISSDGGMTPAPRIGVHFVVLCGMQCGGLERVACGQIFVLDLYGTITTLLAPCFGDVCLLVSHFPCGFGIVWKQDAVACD